MLLTLRTGRNVARTSAHQHPGVHRAYDHPENREYQMNRFANSAADAGRDDRRDTQCDAAANHERSNERESVGKHDEGEQRQPLQSREPGESMRGMRMLDSRSIRALLELLEFSSSRMCGLRAVTALQVVRASRVGNAHRYSHQYRK